MVQDERPTRKVRAAGRTMEGFEETWTETLDRDTLEVEQRICCPNLARSSPVGRRIRHRALRDGVSG